MQEYIPFFQAEKRSIAEKLAKYFEYSGLETKIHYDEENDSYILSVPSKKEIEAKKYYQAFYFVERDRIEKEEMNQEDIEEYSESNIISDSTDVESSFEDAIEEIASGKMDDFDSDTLDDTDADNDTSNSIFHDSTDKIQDTKKPIHDDKVNTLSAEDVDKDPMNTPRDIDADQKASVKSLLSGSGTYVMKSEKYKDYVGTQYVFLLLGILGLVFVTLNVMEILSFLYGPFPNTIMGALFVFFIYVGISTGKKAKQLKLDIDEETQLTDKINEWLRTTITEEFLASISNSELSDELDYIKKTDTIRDMLNKEFGEQNRDYLDRLIEEYYTDVFDTSNDYIEEDIK